MAIRKWLYSGKGCLIPAGLCFKCSRQKEADPIPSLLQDTDLHFLCTLMKQQPSCPPPLTAPLILHHALTSVLECARMCASVVVYNKYVCE